MIVIFGLKVPRDRFQQESGTLGLEPWASREFFTVKTQDRDSFRNLVRLGKALNREPTKSLSKLGFPFYNLRPSQLGNRLFG